MDTQNNFCADERDREIAALLQYLSREQLQTFVDFARLLASMNGNNVSNLDTGKEHTVNAG